MSTYEKARRLWTMVEDERPVYATYAGIGPVRVHTIDPFNGTAFVRAGAITFNVAIDELDDPVFSEVEPPRRPSFWRKLASSRMGFTALELLLVLTVFGLVALAGAPYLFSWKKSLAVQSAASIITAECYATRSRAIELGRGGREFELRFSTRAPNGFELWSSDPQTGVAGPALERRISLPHGVLVKSPAVVRYTWRGTASPANILIGNGHHQKTVRVNFLGRASS